MIKIIPTDLTKGVVEYILLSGKEYTVGRKHSEITLGKDPSVSRDHAIIQVDHPVANVTNAVLIPSLVITDLGSKFGTFVNDGIEQSRPVSMREPNTLSHGDRFRFGLVSPPFRIEYTPLIATSSGIKSLSELKKTICQLGGHLVPEWTENCDYLIMDTITLTVKTVCAVLAAKHIVTPAYFEDYLEAVKTKKDTFPKPEDYLPTLAETSLPRDISFSPDETRTKLFENKLFLFFTNKQTKKIGVAVKCGGGRIGILTDVSRVALKSPDTILVSTNEDLPPNTNVKNAMELYYSARKRMIQESEVGLAAVFNSMNKFCNPGRKSANKSQLPDIASQTQASTHSQRPMDTIVQDSEMLVPTDRRYQPTQSQSGVSRIDETVVETEASSSAVRVEERHAAPDIDEPVSKKSRYDGVNEDLATRNKRSLEQESSSEDTAKPDNMPEIVEIIEPAPKKSKGRNSSNVENTDNAAAAASPRIKRRLDSTEGSPVPKKMCQDENVAPAPLIDEKPLKPAKAVVKPLLMKRDVTILPQVEDAHNNKSLKNFKTFRKVQPMIHNGAASVVSHATTTTNRTTGSTVSFMKYNPGSNITKPDFLQQTTIRVRKEKTPEFGDPF